MENKYEITKEISLIIKGIAAIFVIAGHLLLHQNEYLIAIPIGNTTMAYYLGMFARMGIYIFAFLSGYGLYKSFKKGNVIKSTIKKIIIFLLSYWLILFTLFLPFYIISGSWNTSEFFLSLIGVGHINIYSWYVYFYLIVLITLPLLNLILDKHWSLPLVAIAILLGLLFLLQYFKTSISIYDNIVTCLICYISVLFGYSFSKSSWISKTLARVKLRKSAVIVIALLICFGFYFIYLKWTNGIMLPLMSIFFVVGASLFFTYNVPKFIKLAFSFLGSISIYLWFSHAVILTDYINKLVNFEWFFYLPREAVCVILFTTILLAPICFLYKFIQEKIIKLFFLNPIKLKH